METADLRASKNIQYRAESAGKHYKAPQKIRFKRLGPSGREFESPISGQNERHDESRAFRFGFRGLWPLHPSELSILGRAKPALRNFSASLRIYAALAARPRRAVGWYSVHSHKAEKIDFNRSLQKEGHDLRSCPSFWIPPPGGRRSSIHLSSSQNFCSITAVWARVARPWGERALSPVPLMIPAFTAQSRASRA